MPTNIAPAASRRAATPPSAPPRSRAGRVVLAVVLAALALGVATQLVPWFESADPHTPFGAIRPVMYFTVQSNLLAAIVLAWSAVSWARGRMPSRALEYLRGLATVDLAITAVVYGLLLDGGAGELVLHAVTPLAFAVWWIVLPPHPAVSWAAVPLWLIHPVVWLVLVFGLRAASADHWVPYYFLDPRQVGGWPDVIAFSAAIVGVIALLGVIAVAIARLVPWRARSWRFFGID